MTDASITRIFCPSCRRHYRAMIRLDVTGWPVVDPPHRCVASTKGWHVEEIAKLGAEGFADAVSRGRFLAAEEFLRQAFDSMNEEDGS